MGATAIAAGAVAAAAPLASASSHREAPAILDDPNADNTDLYVFRSPDRPSTATIISNVAPFSVPAGGPNFSLFSTDVRYNVNVDHNGDGRWDTRYQYRFKTSAPQRASTGYLYTAPDGTPLVRQFYDLYRFERDARGTRTGAARLARNLPVAPNNPGPKSLPNYAELRQQAVSPAPGGIRSWAGPADDPFFIDLGMIFDLVNLDQPGRPNIGTGNAGSGIDTLSRYSVLSMALQVPIDELRGDLEGDGDSKIGVYVSTERPVLRRVGRGKNARVKKDYVQVSRLGNPLINEVVIPRFRKDNWNRTSPARDARFSQFYRQPFVAVALNALFPSLNLNVPEKGRTDVEAALLNGLDLTALGLADNSTGPSKADLLRINLATPVTPDPKPMGALQGDPQGYPNGRRLGDDVLDISLRVIGGSLFNLVGGQANKLPLGDGVPANDVPFQATFPYVAPEASGFTQEPPFNQPSPAIPPGPGRLPSGRPAS